MYVDPNFKTKKALKAAVAANEPVYAFWPGLGARPLTDGETVFVEGPHYPKPHTWYAKVQVAASGRVTKVVA